MKPFVALYFFVFALIQLGLFLGVYRYQKTQHLNAFHPSPLWMASLVANILGLSIFGYTVIVVKHIVNPNFVAIIANGLLFIAMVLQGLFYYSLNHDITRNIKIKTYIAAAIFFIVFNWMRQFGTFEMRTAFMCILGIMICLWQIVLIRQKRFSSESTQLAYLQYFCAGEIIFALGRFGGWVGSVPASPTNLHARLTRLRPGCFFEKCTVYFCQKLQ